MTTTSGDASGTGRTLTVRFATVRLRQRQEPLAITFPEVLRRAVVPGTEITYRDRTWHMGQVRPPNLDDVRGGAFSPSSPRDLVSGTIGYDDTAVASSWDQAAKDFIDVDVPSGGRFPFLLDVRRGVLAYVAVKPAGVLSAFQALLNQSGSGHWRVQRILNEQSWEAWRASVERVQRLSFVLRPPNPNYTRRPTVEQMIDGGHAGVVRVVMESDPNALEGLDLESSFIAEAIEHTVQLGYGSVKADGTTPVGGQDVERRYDSKARGSELLAQVPAEDTTSDAAAMSDALSTLSDDQILEEESDDDAPE